MDIQTTFDNFLDKVVNLNKSRVERIEDAQRILSEFIQNQEDFDDLYIDIIPQGSYRQKTIIKPVGDDGSFDVDLLIKLKANSEWTPSDYHTKLAAAFKESDRYKDLTDTQGKTRCVTIDYEGEFHVDLIPVIERGGKHYICNKMTDAFEETDGDGYALWFEQQDVNASGYLVPIVRLLKYLRDSKGDFDTKSIILTTIIAMQVTPDDTFSSISEALLAILERMKNYLSQYDSAPPILNPAMPGENFNRHWKNDNRGFNKFKTAISVYTAIATNAFNATNDEEIIENWQKLFGESFTSESESGRTGAVHSASATYAVGVPFTPSKPWVRDYDNYR